jgi:hypothetical protein
MYQTPYGLGKIFNNAPGWNFWAIKIVNQMSPTASPNLDTKLTWIHRKTADADIYFVLNVRNHPEDLFKSNFVFKEKS